MVLCNTKPLTESQAKTIYQVLVDECGAHAGDSLGFVTEFVSNEPCREWRFQGSLGFGGKFRYPRMSVDCYPEDETPARLTSIVAANKRLADLTASFL
jgi:hypothetical protein